MEGQINIKVSLDTRGLHQDWGEILAYPERERGPFSIECRWKGSWGSSRDSNLSTVDRNLHGRVYGIGKILSILWSWQFLIERSRQSLMPRRLILRHSDFWRIKLSADAVQVNSHFRSRRRALCCENREYYGQLFCRRQRASRKCQTYQWARVQTPPASHREK